MGTLTLGITTSSSSAALQETSCKGLTSNTPRRATGVIFTSSAGLPSTGEGLPFREPLAQPQDGQRGLQHRGVRSGKAESLLLVCWERLTIQPRHDKEHHGSGPGKSRHPRSMPGEHHIPLHVLPAPSPSPLYPQRNSDGLRRSCQPGSAEGEAAAQVGAVVDPEQHPAEAGHWGCLPLPECILTPAAPGHCWDVTQLISVSSRTRRLTVSENTPLWKSPAGLTENYTPPTQVSNKISLNRLRHRSP